MTALTQLLSTYRAQAQTKREQGTYFEQLIQQYLRAEPCYQDLYSDVWLYAEWAAEHGHHYDRTKTDLGIDLVAKTRGSDEYHAIQCKNYAADYRLQKSDIDSFFTASGQRPFTHRLIVTTTARWSIPADAALRDQQPQVTKIDLHDLENSQIDWARYQPDTPPPLKPQQALRPHQATAVKDVVNGLQHADRGKLIMACGSGKTFVSLKVAERLTAPGQRVLFLVPSLALLSQALTEWTQQSTTPLHCFAVCSDSHVGKQRRDQADDPTDDRIHTYTHELRYPATTDARQLAAKISQCHDAQHLSVVFATYHSIDVIHTAQHRHGLAAFDLVISDEAHRTTGATFGDQAASHFVRVHDADYLRAAKRLYMTATPRVYGDTSKAQAATRDITLASMDDTKLYGKQLHVLSFSAAVEQHLLTDYKVLVLAIDQAHISTQLQELLKDAHSLRVDDAAKIVGCWKALSKQGSQQGSQQDVADDLADDPQPMQRAVAFCQVIEAQHGSKTHKISSKQIAASFQHVVETYQRQSGDTAALTCEADHVDGTMNATQKIAKLNWLKATPTHKAGSNAGRNADSKATCRILSNVRCLSEGVDVPALDAVLFLTPRDSQVEVVQSVGRVMRKSPGKTRGYVILPVVIPPNTDAETALDNNQAYQVVWQVLQALRSHDDRFDAFINKLDLSGKQNDKMEVIAVTDNLQKPAPSAPAYNPRGGQAIGVADQAIAEYAQQTIPFKIGEIERALYAKVVQKCGNRQYWDEWAKDIATIAQTHLTRITTIVTNPANTAEAAVFNAFVKELRDDLNDSLSDTDAIEMLAQHLITKPVFDALFEGYSFAAKNPVSRAMQKTLDALQQHHLDKEAATLERFYRSVKLRAQGIDNAQGKQKIILELYDKFFKNAFPKMTERLGIVYTPVELVDFIIHSVDHLLKHEFNQTLGSKDVHIIDPFTGTGTFITRLLQSGLITPAQLKHKYTHEIHANEIVLLAYYIAAINIEAAYHDIIGGEYQPFEGICLTDTFQLYEKDDLVSAVLEDNSARRTRQKKLDIQVIVGNPPYSVGQKSNNDNNQNVAYASLDERIRTTYAKQSTAKLAKGLYDSYIRAIRWASDRVGNRGIIGFVTGSSFIEGASMDGLRKCLAEEFSSLYFFNLRGDIRKNMLSGGAAKEGQNVFGSASMTGIAISLLVKNPKQKTRGHIYYNAIGDDLHSAQKLDVIRDFTGIAGISRANAWQTLTPDTHNDWLNQRDDRFTQFIAMGDKKQAHRKSLFSNYSRGLITCRDAWCYNSSKQLVAANMQRMIDFYNSECERYQKSDKSTPIIDFVDNDSTKIKWARALRNFVSQGKSLSYSAECLVPSQYRLFDKRWLYFNRQLNEMVYQMPQIFPNAKLPNKAICVTGVGANSGFSTLMVDALPNLHTLDSAQCFPRYLYQKTTTDSSTLLEQTPAAYTRQDAITDAALAHFQQAYPQATAPISKDDLFYYTYGLLHSPQYRQRFKNNLSKQLPRIPAVKTYAAFQAYATAGRKLATLHVDYDNVKPHPLTLDTGHKTLADLTPEHYRVTKMKVAKNDPTTVIYNPHLTLKAIPARAWHYIINGKPALKWLIERQGVKLDKPSQITNDANHYATETLQNPKYPLELFQRVITLSLETLDIIDALPELDID